MHSVDCMDGISKTGAAFGGQITDIFNITTEPHRRRTFKNLKDHWSVYNARVSLFNAVYNQEVLDRQSGADDLMVMKAAKARYAQKTGQKFRHYHWWQVVRHQPKWSMKHGDGPSGDVSNRTRLGASSGYSSDDRSTEEEVTRPMGRDRAKAAARKGKGKTKASTSSQSGIESTEVGGMLKNLCKITKEYTQVKLWKQWNRLIARPTDNLTASQKKIHERAIKQLKKTLNIADEDAEEDDEGGDE